MIDKDNSRVQFGCTDLHTTCIIFASHTWLRLRLFEQDDEIIAFRPRTQFRSFAGGFHGLWVRVRFLPFP